MSRALEIGKALGQGASAGAGGLVPAVAVDYIPEDTTFLSDWYGVPLIMIGLGMFGVWKGKEWMKPIAYGMIGAGGYAAYRNYRAENPVQKDAGNVYGLPYSDAGNVFGPPRETAALPMNTTTNGYPYAYPYQQQNA